MHILRCIRLREATKVIAYNWVEQSTREVEQMLDSEYGIRRAESRIESRRPVHDHRIAKFGQIVTQRGVQRQFVVFNKLQNS